MKAPSGCGGKGFKCAVVIAILCMIYGITALILQFVTVPNPFAAYETK